jgi:hypothetical protein
VLPEELFDTLILHLGSGGYSKILAALGAPLGADEFRNELVNVFDIHFVSLRNITIPGRGFAP